MACGEPGGAAAMVIPVCSGFGGPIWVSCCVDGLPSTSSWCCAVPCGRALYSVFFVLFSVPSGLGACCYALLFVL